MYNISRQSITQERSFAHISGMKTSLLENATAADRYATTFTWQNPGSFVQTAYRINMYSRRDSQKLIYQSDWIVSTNQTAVTVDGLRAKIIDNQLYYWTVDVKYSNGECLSSSRTPFVTAVGDDWASKRLAWAGGAAGLFRTTVNTDLSRVEKAMLTVTAKDTSVARRNVYNIYINGKEIGIGPNQSFGNNLFYNTYDITNNLNEGSNIIGTYAYSQSKSAGILMQLTYFYKDGSSKVVYNSGRDTDLTQALRVDAIVYGDSGQSIGTSYYEDLAQNADLTQWPYGWQNIDDYINNAWKQPYYLNIPVNMTLRPAITGNMSRRTVEAQTITQNSDGSWTIDFGHEIEGGYSARNY